MFVFTIVTASTLIARLCSEACEASAIVCCYVHISNFRAFTCCCSSVQCLSPVRKLMHVALSGVAPDRYVHAVLFLSAETT